MQPKRTGRPTYKALLLAFREYLEETSLDGAMPNYENYTLAEVREYEKANAKAWAVVELASSLPGEGE